MWMKLEAVEDHTPWNVNRGEKSYRWQTGREEPGEQSLQTEVNVTNTEIRNLIGLKEKKIRVINYSLTWTRTLQNLISPGSFFNYSQPYGILLSIVSDLFMSWQAIFPLKGRNFFSNNCIRSTATN